jgi:hypothetical protein
MTTFARTESQTFPGTRTAVAAAGVAGAVASAGVLAGWFLLSDQSQAQVARSPLTVVEYLIAAAAYVALAICLPSLPACRLPRWMLYAGALACASIAIQAWAFGTIIAHLADQVPSQQFDDLGRPAFLLLLVRLPLQISGLVAFVALAVVGWRRRAMARGACVLFAVAGLAALIGDFPPAGLLAGLALAWTARTTKADLA